MSTTVTAPDAAFENPTSLIGEGMGQEIAVQLEDNQLGVMVESPPAFDAGAFVDALARESGYSTGLVLVNINDDALAKARDQATDTALRVTDDLSDAIKWRNSNPVGGLTWDDREVPERIVLLVRGDPPKLGSMHRLSSVPLGQVRRRITILLRERPEFDKNAPAQELWEALETGLEANLSITAIAEYGVATVRESEQASLDALGAKLHHLGLFVDPNVLQPGEIATRLNENHDLVGRVTRITNRDRKRLTNSIRKAEAERDDRESQAEFISTVLQFQKTNDDSYLGEIPYERIKAAMATSSQYSPGSGGGGGGSGGGSSDGGGGGRRYDRRTDDAGVGLELAFDNDDEELASLDTEFESEFDEALEKDERRVEITYDTDKKLLVDIESDLYYFIKRFVDEETFGGIIAGAESRNDAIGNVNSLETEPFRPADEESSFSVMRRFAERNEEFQSTVDALDTYLEARNALVEAIPELLHTPMLSLLGDEVLRTAASDYLQAYQDAQDNLDRKYRALQDESAKGARRLLSEFLLLDTIIIETEQGRELVLSPLHPLHLWKYVELAQEVTTRRDQLTAEEREFLIDTVEDQPHVLNSITVGGGRKLPEETYLLQSDEVGSLPVYTEADRASPGSNKYLWEYLIEKFTAAYPPATARLKLSVIDPIRPADLLSKIAKAAQNGQLTGATIEYAFVNTDEQHILEGTSSTEEENIIAVFGPDSDFTDFNIRTQTAQSIDDYASTLRDEPQHCVVVNDRSSFFIEEFERDSETAIHPLYVPKEFEYDAFEDEINISASTEGELFSEYQNLLNQLSNARQDLHKAGVHELDTSQETVETLTQHAIWACISAPAMNTDPFWETDLISKERRGDRDYAVYSRDIDLFTRTLRRILNEYPIAPEETDVEAIAARIAATQQSGLLRLLTEETIGEQQSRNTKGMLGSIIAVQWLEEEFPDPKLIFSIDDPRTRRWLNFGDSNRRADFIVAEMDGKGGLRLHIVEVKTLDQPGSAFSIDQSQSPPMVSGDAVDQLIETATTIRSLFDGEDNVTTPPRREALREQLYYELLGSDTTESKEGWARRINDVFRGDASISIEPRILSVEISSGHRTESHIECTTDEAQALDIDRLPRGTIVRLLLAGTDDVAEQLAEPEEDGDDPAAPSPAEDEAASDDAAAITEQAATTEEQADTEKTPDTDDTDAGDTTHPDDTGATLDAAADSDNTPLAAAGDDDAFASGSDYAAETEELKRVLADFDVKVRNIDPANVDVGPNIIRYKVELAPGETQGKLEKRSADIAREMALEREPIIHRLGGTKFVAIDVPRPDRKVVTLGDYIDQLPAPSEITPGQLPFIAGVTPSGAPKIADLQDAPHMLVGGTTGSGKTVFLYSLLACILERQTVDDVRLAIIDPKLTNFMFFNGLPNLEHDQVITDGADAFELFEWIVSEEIPRRTQILADSGSIDIREHNQRSDDTLRPLVIVIDEYADLLDDLETLDQDDEFEVNVRRIAQKARSVGIHLVISTQRPSANIIDTDLRANLDMRVAFRLPADSDSRIILDEAGAEELGGEGDMLFKEADEITRLQGTFVETDDLRDLVDRES